MELPNIVLRGGRGAPLPRRPLRPGVQQRGHRARPGRPADGPRDGPRHQARRPDRAVRAQPAVSLRDARRVPRRALRVRQRAARRTGSRTPSGTAWRRTCARTRCSGIERLFRGHAGAPGAPPGDLPRLRQHDLAPRHLGPGAAQGALHRGADAAPRVRPVALPGAAQEGPDPRAPDGRAGPGRVPVRRSRPPGRCRSRERAPPGCAAAPPASRSSPAASASARVGSPGHRRRRGPRPAPAHRPAARPPPPRASAPTVEPSARIRRPPGSAPRRPRAGAPPGSWRAPCGRRPPPRTRVPRAWTRCASGTRPAPAPAAAASSGSNSRTTIRRSSRRPRACSAVARLAASESVTTASARARSMPSGRSRPGWPASPMTTGMPSARGVLHEPPVGALLRGDHRDARRDQRPRDADADRAQAHHDHVVRAHPSARGPSTSRMRADSTTSAMRP